MIKQIIILGAPGVGKGTVAKELEKRKKIVHISTGDIFRSHIKSNSKIGQEVQSIIASGGYVPDELTNRILKERILQDDVKEQGFILDGYPRTINQATFLKSNRLLINAVILLEADSELIKKRIAKRAAEENRHDDLAKVVEKRIKIYQEKTAPLIKYYEDEQLLKRVNASGTIEENINNVLEALND